MLSYFISKKMLSFRENVLSVLGFTLIIWTKINIWSDLKRVKKLMLIPGQTTGGGYKCILDGDMVLVLDGNLAHVAHVWRYIGIFWSSHRDHSTRAHV